MVNGNDTMNPTVLTTVGSGASATSSFTVIQETPEPSTLVLLASAAAILSLRAFAARQRRHPSSQALCI